jgi:hypothetical protein
VGLWVAASVAQAAPPPIKATGAVEVPDAAGDMGPMLSIKSDGSRLTIGATLKDPPGSFASSVVEVYLHSDNTPQRGVEIKTAAKR